MSPVTAEVPKRRSGRRWGQCFLRDAGVIQRIVKSMNLSAEQRVLEIGPGRGALTIPLLEQLHTLHAVEKDPELSSFLRESFPEHLVVHNECALKFDYHAWEGTSPWRLVGNLPYSISTPLLFRLRGLTGLTDMTFMMQKEVADRLSATPGTAAYGRLSVMIGCRWQVERLFIVEPGSFSPPPKVRSAVIRLFPLPAPLLADDEEPMLDKVVRLAFSGRRKQLSTALSNVTTASCLVDAGIDPRQRAADLNPEQYVRLARAIAARSEDV